MRRIYSAILEQWGWPGWLVPNYWFMLCLSLVLGALLTVHLWRRSGQDGSEAGDRIFWALPWLFVGAKLIYWLQYGFPRGWDWAGWGGIGLYGGFLGLAASWGISWWRRPYRLGLFLDCVAPSLALGLFLTRIGCFLAGCNGGIPTSLPWGVRFPMDTCSFNDQLAGRLIGPGATLSLAAHPTQLYESLFGLVFLGLLLWHWRRRADDGRTFLLGMAGYAAFRFAMEPLRADTGGWHPGGLFTFAQSISLLILLALGSAWIARKYRIQPVKAGQ